MPNAYQVLAPLAPQARRLLARQIEGPSRGMMPTAPPILWVQQPNGHDAQRLSLPGPLLSHGRDAPMLTMPRPGRDAHTPFHSTGAAAPSQALQCANVSPIWVQDTMVARVLCSNFEMYATMVCYIVRYSICRQYYSMLQFTI